MSSNNYKDKKILIVDDEEEIREILSRVLTRTGYDVMTVEDGVAALEEIKNYKPDLIFLDIMMPGMNGVQFLKKISPLGEKPYKVVIVSGFVNDETREECYSFGANQLLDKPFDIGTILNIAKENLMK